LHLGFVTCYLLLFLLYACEDGYQPEFRISIDKETLEIKEGDEATLNLTVVKSSKLADTYTVKWESDNPAVATVKTEKKGADGELFEVSPDEGITVESSIIILFTVTAIGVKDQTTTITLTVTKDGPPPEGEEPEKETCAVIITD